LLVKKILEYIESPESQPANVAYLYLIGLVVANSATTIVHAQSLFIGRRIGFGVRAIVISEVYAKSLRRNAMVRTDSVFNSDENGRNEGQENHGAAITLMAIDSGKLFEAFSYLANFLIAVPLQVIIGIGLLYSVIGWSAIAGVCVMVILIPINYYVSTALSTIQKEIMRKTTIRVQATNEAGSKLLSCPC
jgi:hypothetical protein